MIPLHIEILYQIQSPTKITKRRKIHPCNVMLNSPTSQLEELKRLEMGEIHVVHIEATEKMKDYRYDQ